MYQVAVIVGSLRKDSFNKKLAKALDKLNHPELHFNFIDIADIPLYNQDHESNLPAVVAAFKTDIEQSDAVLIATPEYNRSIPGVLKNVIDWGTRPYGENSWTNKPIGMIGATPGGIGTAVAQSHLRSIMTTVGGIVMGQPEVYFVFKKDIINDNHEITNDDTKKFLQAFLDTFTQWIKNHRMNN